MSYYRTCGLSPPLYPTVGDRHIDSLTGLEYIYYNRKWANSSGGAVYSKQPQMISVPSDEDLQKYPALKTAWEEFLSIKKLLGIT